MTTTIRPLQCLWLMMGLSACNLATAADPVVDLEVILPPQAPPTLAHDWMTALKKLPLAGIRLHSGRGGEQPEVRRDEKGPVVSYRVRGILTQNSQLQLPGAVFSRRDLTRLGEWMKSLERQFGPPVPEAHAFGLSAAQLVSVHQTLARQITETTRGRKPQQVVTLMARELGLRLHIQSSTRRGFAEADPVADELQGVAGGTALAAALRPLGLVMVPRFSAAGQLELTVMDVRQAAESWPIGWPAEGSLRQLAPKLYEFLEVNIDEVPLARALSSIQSRLDLPLLWDHNGLARQRIDPAATLISFPARRTFYKRIINNILFQAHLRSELRVDEAEQPFLWIYPAKR